MTDQPTEKLSHLPSQKLRLALQITAVADVLVTVGLVVYGLIKETIDQRANTSALCALRSDLQARVDQGNAFLAKHPRGFAGISAATIRTSISGQERTIKALSPIDCPKVLKSKGDSRR